MNNGLRTVTDNEISRFMSVVRDHGGGASSCKWDEGVIQELYKISGKSPFDAHFNELVAGQCSNLETSAVTHWVSDVGAVYQRIIYDANESALQAISLPACSKLNPDIFNAGSSYFLSNVSYLNLGCCSSLNGISNLPGLETLILPSVTVIGKKFARDNTSIKKVELPMATVMDDQAFFRDYSLQEIYCPNVSIFGMCCFASCSELTSFTTNCSSKVDLDSWAFEDCKALSAVYFPYAPIVKVSHECFIYTSIFSVFDAPMASIIDLTDGSRQFASTQISCLNLNPSAKIYLGTNPSMEETFTGCKINTSQVEDILSRLYTTDISGTGHILKRMFISCYEMSGTLSIPANISQIREGAFEFDKISSLYLTSVADVGEYTFFDCPNLSQVSFGAAPLSVISNFAFNSCPLLEFNLSSVTSLCTLGIRPLPDASELSSTFHIYVPDSCVELYKTDSTYGWVSWSSFIYGASQYPTFTKALKTAATAVKNFFVLSSTT